MNIPEIRYETIRNVRWWDRQRYRLTEDWEPYSIGGYLVVFPRGFETDLASIPRLMWSIPGFSPSGPLMYGSIPHDFGYQYGYLLTRFSKDVAYSEDSLVLRAEWPHKFNEFVPVLIGRPQKDFDRLLFTITSKATGASVVAKSAEIALSIFGKLVWNKYRRLGPSAYNTNSLMLPGITSKGMVF